MVLGQDRAARLIQNIYFFFSPHKQMCVMKLPKANEGHKKTFSYH